MKIGTRLTTAALFIAAASLRPSSGAPATLLFEDDFNRGIPGWTQVQPAGTYIDGPMRWQYDIVSGAFLEQSNIYTDAANFSPSATAVMLINDAVAGTNFTYTARLTAGDDDAFGLIFGYANGNNFFRVTFTRQIRTDNGFPWNGWNVDQKINNVATNLFGDGADGIIDPAPSFINTQFQPFDVTIGVTNGIFSLTILDDPEGGQIEYRLVEGQPLAGLPANGRVGMFTWGQSGTALRGFRIQDLSLSPVALVGNPNALTDWTPVIPPRGDGTGLTESSGNGGRAIWSLALGQNGPFGTLHENSDAFGGNDEQGQVDFVAPSIVAGETTWSNYVMKARILPGDDDGHGILVRYLDEQNFYRIALRNQDSPTGPRKGLSIQKVVGGGYEDVYFDDPVKYDPLPNAPYEITAAVFGDRLQVLVIGNAGSPAATAHVYGPFDITGGSVPNGKIGFFSWGMSRTEFDWVRVYSIDGVPLEISSPFGSPTPEAGLSGFPPGTSVTATAPSPAVESPGIRHVVTGWTGLGSVPASGTANTVTFVLNDISLLNWLWQTEYQLSLNNQTGGTITGPSAEWLAAGTNITIVAQADPGFVFTGWTGSSASLNPQLNVRLSGPLTLTPRFEMDSDNDGLPDSWEQANFGSLAETGSGDADNDGRSNLDEFRQGTSPIASEELLAGNQLTSRWENVQRDPALPGQLVVRNYGPGFRGVWENSNDFREAEPTSPANLFVPLEQAVANVSFEGPRIIIREDVWQNSWSNFVGQATFDFGDNDAGNVYFRYMNESNWYRVTIVAENNAATWRAPYGLSVQKRVDGIFSELARSEAIAGDPTDESFYKRIRITVEANGPNFNVTATGWNAFATPAQWDTSTEVTLSFMDTDLPNGRFGIGTWGQSGGNTATETNPVGAGMLIDDVIVRVGGNEVFREDWEQIPLAEELPAGWTNPFAGTTAGGNWQISAHGAIIQTANFAPSTTGTVTNPKADAESSILVSPPFESESYLLELAIHPFDDDGIGFLYDYQDTNNFARVIFVAEATANGRMPQGVSVSRKSNGTWSDLSAGDTSFVYTPGQPFRIQFARSPGASRMTLWEVDRPQIHYTWSWSEDAPAAGSNQFGFAAWGQQDAHFTHASVFRIKAETAPGGLSITSVARTGNTLQLEIANPANATFDVQASPDLSANSWSTVAENQDGSTWTTPLTGGRMFFRLLAR